MYVEFLKAQSNLVWVDTSTVEHKPSQISVCNWKYPIKIHKALDVGME